MAQLSSGQMYLGLCMAGLWDIMTNYIAWSVIGGLDIVYIYVVSRPLHIRGI